MKPEINFVCLLDWANAYLEFSMSRFVSKTFEEKKGVFKRFFKINDPVLSVELLRPGHVLSYLQNQNDNRSGYAANKDRKNLVAAWNWGIKYFGLPLINPCLVERFSETKQVRYVPSESDFWKVYDVAETVQDKVMLLAYLHLAGRRSEIFHLRWLDIDFSESKARLYTRKRKGGSLESDWLPLTDDLYNSFLDLKQTSNNEWVFPSPQTQIPYAQRNKWLWKLCELAEVKRFGIHAIRHLTASILAKSDVSMIDIQSILRHRNLATTERYIRRLSSLRPALMVLPGIKATNRGHQVISKKIGNQSK
jgi:integrase